ncbi:MAG: hypothetical protein DI556_09350 [Rhodovulum sulfidophilum]|uniref:Two pore domain potassium channel family protein n=1 Tax=Rhodovulum sulfidophilum TaxID=35806 RepID=A0A2W5NAT3_RHOSU|nr:MAG: hypothetical protein DI556_09350 [Rhodovulum sulfidophilum]
MVQKTYPLAEFAFAVMGLVIIIFIHGIGVRHIARRFNGQWARLPAQPQIWRTNFLFARVIAALVVLHLSETVMLAVAIRMLDLLPTLRDCYYYVMESYTTLGANLVQVPEGWRLTGPIIGMAGLFTFGWTSSLLVSVMVDLGRLDRAEAVTEARRESGDKAMPEAEF